MTVTKRRFTLFNLLIVCLVAGAGLAAFRAVVHNTQGLTLNEDREMVTFTVTFVPKSRSKAVNVRLAIGSSPSEEYYPTQSPWISTRLVRRGEPVLLLAEQSQYGVVSCKIRAGMRKVGEDKQDVGVVVGVRCEGVV